MRDAGFPVTLVVDLECLRRRLTSLDTRETGNFDVIEVDQFGKRLVVFLPNLRRFAISLCRSRDLADDLVQATCERALANAGRFEPGTRFDAWMFRILRNLWIDHIRKQRTAGPQEGIEQRQELVGASGERDVEARLTLNSVAQAITDLPVDLREVILLVCVEDLSYREAADVLGIPIGTVMSRLARARKNLAEAAGITPGLSRSPIMKGENKNDQMRVCRRNAHGLCRRRT
jgi:RNA polymerase sigma-70 factor (ECF subfamily)